MLAAAESMGLARPVPGLSRLLWRSGLVNGDDLSEPPCALSLPRSALASSPNGNERSRAMTPHRGHGDLVWPTASQIATALAHSSLESEVPGRTSAVHNERLHPFRRSGNGPACRNAVLGSESDPSTDSMWPSVAQIFAALSQSDRAPPANAIGSASTPALVSADPATQCTTAVANPMPYVSKAAALLSSRNHAVAMQPPSWMKMGLAVKQGGFYPNWKRRLFVLDGRSLRYFRPSDRAERGAISLGLIRNVLEVGEEVHVVTPKRTFKFVADDCDNLSWVRAINHNRRVLKGPSRSAR